MRTEARIAVAVFAAPWLIAAETPRGQLWTDTLFAPAADVELTLSTPQPSYSVGAEPTVTYRIRNVSAKPLYVPTRFSATCPAVSRYSMWLEDSHGRHLTAKGGYGGSCVPDTKPSSPEQPADHQPGKLA